MAANKGLVNNITYFLGSYRASPTPDQLTPRVSWGLGSVGNDEEPQETHFRDATWELDLPQSPSSSGNSFGDDLFSNMALDYAPSEGSQATTDGSSVDTPPPAEELSVDNSGPRPVIDIDELNNPLAIPYYDKSQAIPRPQTLLIANRVSKTRVVKDLDKTNQVRGVGACIRCRIKKTPCSATHSCEGCKKDYPQYSQTPEICCIHNELAAVAKDYAFRRFDALNGREETTVKESLRRGGPRFRNSRFKGHILFDQDISKLGIPAVLAEYDCTAEGYVAPSGCTFAKDFPNPALDRDNLLRWAGQAFSPIDNDTFEGVIESFIKTSIQPPCLGALPAHVLPLLGKVHMFKCMYKICRSGTLSFLLDGGVHAETLPFPAQVEIRGIARQALESSERDILTELDKLFKTQKLEDKERPAIWAVLWQLMLVYRDLLRNRKPWLNNAEPLFNAVAVFYAAFFRNIAALKFYEEGTKNFVRQHATQQAELQKAFEGALDRRDVFYQTINAGVDHIDQRLKAIVVSPEIKLLDRMSKKKNAAKRRATAHAHDGDAVMQG